MQLLNRELTGKWLLYRSARRRKKTNSVLTHLVGHLRFQREYVSPCYSAFTFERKIELADLLFIRSVKYVISY